MHKYINTFENFQVGPYVAIDATKTIKEHYRILINGGVIPIALITDPEHQIFKDFKSDEDDNFKKIAVFITVKYMKPYE